MDKIRFGLIGTGKIADSSALNIKTHPHGDVVACQDLSRERREAFASRFEAKAYAEVGDLLADESIDAVSIAVPNKFHAPLAIQSLEAGKHVLLEKPFAMNASEAEDVLKVAEKSGKTFMLGMNQRYHRDSQIVKQLINSGALGEIYYVKAYWFRRSGIPRLGTWFGNKDLAGAGAINDIGVHFLDLALHLMGNFEPASVSGATYTKFGNRGLGEGGWGNSDPSDKPFDVDDLSSAQIRMKNGASIILEVAWACHTDSANKMNVEIFGTEGGATVYPAEFYTPGEKKGKAYQIVQGPEFEPALPHCDKFHNFINHIVNGEELLVKPDEALTVQRILDAVAESNQVGHSVQL